MLRVAHGLPALESTYEFLPDALVGAWESWSLATQNNEQAAQLKYARVVRSSAQCVLDRPTPTGHD
ncbi:hypothetical protein D6833_06710 [Candidatus Parcubacteria bacterium]|nr:MAG: hypothetical protein D6833_06710 [Candidatus Parcubacteria bacterium]